MALPMWGNYPVNDDDGNPMPNPNPDYSIQVTGSRQEEPPLTHLPYPINPGQPATPLAPFNPGDPGLTMPQGGNGGGFNIMDFLGQIFGGGQGNPLGMTSLIPAMATAWKHYNDAGKYGDTARQAAEMASPVSLEERRRHQARIGQLYDDPEAFLEANPEFRATRDLGLKKLNALNAARGMHTGDGKSSQDQLRFLSDIGSRFIDQERKALMHMGGYQFDPGRAAEITMRGNEQEIAAKNAALAALMYPFGAGQGAPRGPNSQDPNGAVNRNIPRPNGNSGANPAGAIGQIARSLGLDLNDPIVRQIWEQTGGSTPWGLYSPQEWDADGDGTMTYDEWAAGNNADVSNQLLDNGSGAYWDDGFQSIPEDGFTNWFDGIGEKA